MLRFRKPRVLLAFPVILSMCEFQMRLLDTSTPRFGTGDCFQDMTMESVGVIDLIP